MIALVLRIVVMVVCVSVGFAGEEQDSKALYRSLERHLQSLKSLEIHYRATGAAPDGAVSGRMIFVKPDRFYHDTPEWTLCEHGPEQWRYLKDQQTVILEKGDAREWLPETLLLNLGKDMKPSALVAGEGGSRVLLLSSDDISAPAAVSLYFAANELRPSAIQYMLDDGSEVRYELEQWLENKTPSDELFQAPSVPAENLIDFRSAKPK